MRKAFTLIEALTVLAIIALLTGILIPTLSAVKNFARETKQNAQFSTIGLGLTAFKNDYGDYPPSDGPPTSLDYCGAQKLAEALLGWDLLGFHPKSTWKSDGNPPYDIDDLSGRKGLYLRLTTANAFRLSSLFKDVLPLAANTFVICDVFEGVPILYYKADTSKKDITLIYDAYDNDVLVSIKQTADRKNHPLSNPAFGFRFFYGTSDPMDGIVGYIQNPKITARPWPYNPDSYILISAGIDGLYGTDDDICNY